MSDSIITTKPDHSIVILGRVSGKSSSIFGFDDQVQSYLRIIYDPVQVQPHGLEGEHILIEDSPMAVINFLAKFRYRIAFISGSPDPNKFFMWTLTKQGENK
ncbi:uncharacterized protein LOC141536600 [Cotesia typhae]|uniref:uncharacterized protein LOC141536600 n=1 Tax=Cotesia typhae TaxID=2053667 RepID=UPI003D69C16C